MAVLPLPPFHIERRSGGEAEMVLVYGELDLCTAPHLAAELRSAQETGSDVIVNLEQVEFIDCAALHVLLDASAASGEARFSITPGRRQVRRLFQLTGAGAVLDVVPPERRALRIAA